MRMTEGAAVEVLAKKAAEVLAAVMDMAEVTRR